MKGYNPMTTDPSSRHVLIRTSGQDCGSAAKAAAKAARIWAAGAILVLAPILGSAGAVAAQSHATAGAGQARSHQHGRAAAAAPRLREMNTPRRPWLF